MGIILKPRTIQGIPALAISGRVIGSDSEKFKKKLEDFCGKGHPTVLIDLTETEFIDSFGLGILVGNHKLLSEEGRRLVLLNANPNPTSYVRRLFEMTHLTRVFTIVADEESLKQF
jgi:anti-anti-sigma factor